MTQLNTDFRITPKRLGMIEMESFCPECFWYLFKQKFHPPFNHFGGAIFKNMEQAQMAVIGNFLEEDAELPEEFAPFRDLVSRVDYPRHWSKFKHTLDSGALLYGEPDDIFNLSDGSIAVVDHKTAQPKGTGDPFLPCYEVQVIGYALIAEFGLNLGKVSKGGLFYWGANHESVISEPGKFYRNKKLWMPFTPSPLAIDIDYSRLDEPLKEAARLWNAKTPPEGSEKCKDCKKLAELFTIGAEVEKQLALQDQIMLSGSGNSRFISNYVAQRVYDRQQTRNSALQYLRDDAMELDFANDGMVANWEVFHDHGF
jgi:hypothetical protein